MTTAVPLSAAAHRLRDVLDVIQPGTPEHLIAELDGLLIDPNALRATLGRHLGESAHRVRVSGTLDRRLVCIERPDGRWIVADLAGQAHTSRSWPAWATGHIELETPNSWLSNALIDESAAHRLSKPDVLLAALYHPENFPLPRFPLGISDVARAARSTLTGTVRLADMQLGTSIHELVKTIADQTPDILGISATFGQHDLLTTLLDAAFSLAEPPLIVVGGSLVARNERMLLDRYPDLLVARGAGEPTIRDVLAYWHGEISREEVQGIGYTGAARGEGTFQITRQRTTARPRASEQPAGDLFPELDLLPATLAAKGVGQCECSRGCTNYCSFCPRGHKGAWFGGDPGAFPWFLAEVRRVYDRYPHVPKVLYAVDEEFVGHEDGAVDRTLAMARTLHGAGFQWETSCRVDQVVRLDRDDAWHLERAAMWRELQDEGLRRCLFGIESGVDSILERFNKETTSDQNARAIRTLSTLGVPTRYTYITFDQLMTLEELKATYAFQGRTDLLLKPLPHLTPQEIVLGVQDPAFIAEHSTGRPFHTAVSYMLVSMECLTGAAYTRQATAAGLTGDELPQMGRVEARFQDWRIGQASHWAQLWVDRHFALDYTLKSLEKILAGETRKAVRAARVVLKDAAYTVFGHLIEAIDAVPLGTAESLGAEGMDRHLRRTLEGDLGELADRLAGTVRQVSRVLPRDLAVLLEHEHTRWVANSDWRLINAAESCGT
ncbi:hypothetical protein GCM10010430_43860 [Kitasatospora cystarginea]|uniref:B12-binding domain-containing protein n=1 Tax=Kitasatospora cystarginea TaxID=58350 RepID=A0ABN3EDW9_9ACTN